MSTDRLFLEFVFAAALLACSQPCLAQDNTNPAAIVPNSNEPNVEAAECPPLTSFPQLAGSIVVSCQRGDSVAVAMPLAPDAQGLAREKSVRGVYDYREYRISQADQQEQAFENLMRLIPMAGFIVKYSDNSSTITARNGDTWVLIRLGGDNYNVSVVHEVEEPWTPVKSAEEISQEMKAHNRVAIHGIQFSPENQAIQEAQSEILRQVLEYLKQHPDLAVVIESHKVTPKGSPEGDLEITRARADAVVAWLVAHGIPPARLQAKPFGRSKPLTENDTALEIKKNDRIVLARTTK